MNKEEIIKDKKVLEALEPEYKHVCCLVDSVRRTVTDLNFYDRVPDPVERQLMKEQLQAVEAFQTNLFNRIQFYRNRIAWGEEMVHHCGQDADMDDACCQAREKCQVGDGSAAVNEEPVITGESLRNLLGMQVCRCNVPCDVCAIDKRVGACVKLELVGGDYICLAPTPQEDERPVISFDEENEEDLGDIMAGIREKADDFMSYLESIFKTEE